MLAYLEEEVLFQQFKLDEPWDSPHNRPLLARMPKIYSAPAEDGQTRDASGTFYQLFVGSGAAFEDLQGANLQTDFPDGLANTILVIEAAEPVPWTKPVDLPYQSGAPLPSVGGIFTTEGRFSLFGSNRVKGFNAAFADGSLRWLPADIPEEQLRALVTRNGGENVDQERKATSQDLREHCLAGGETIAEGVLQPAR
jgi:hypothetical protein